MIDRSLRVALVVVAVALAATLVVTTTTSTTTFGPYNPGWNGTGEMRSTAADHGQVEIIGDASNYDQLDPDGSVVFVLAPTDIYYAESGEAIQSYVQRGGTVVVAGDRGQSADWLVRNLTQYRINQAPVLGLAAYTEGPALPLVHPFADRSIDGVESVSTNLPGSIENVPPKDRLLVSSSTAFRDRNGDRHPDRNEPLGPFTVAAEKSVGDGQVIVLADPSVVIDGMIDRRDNRAFAEWLIGDNDRIYFDRSHAPGAQPPLVGGIETLRTNPVAQILVFGAVALGLAGIVAWTARRRD